MPQPPKEEDRIYINELAKLVHRRVGTIRKWQAEERLPKRLLPRRGKANRRYWTKTQVYGKRGIIEWMKKNNMRPGNLVTDPSKESEHVENLRKPKYINGHIIRSARIMAENGRTREFIIKKLFPRTRYVHAESLERALEQVAAAGGWELPPAPPKPKPERKPRAAQMTKRQKRELASLEKRVARLNVKVNK